MSYATVWNENGPASRVQNNPISAARALVYAGCLLDWFMEETAKSELR